MNGKCHILSFFVYTAYLRQLGEISNPPNTYQSYLHRDYWFIIIFLQKMYGLLLENFSEYVKSVYGEDKWEEIRRKAGVEQPSFSVHQVYSESLIPKLARSAMEVRTLRLYNLNFNSSFGFITLPKILT